MPNQGVSGIVIKYRANLWRPDLGHRNSLCAQRVNKQVYLEEMR